MDILIIRGNDIMHFLFISLLDCYQDGGRRGGGLGGGLGGIEERREKKNKLPRSWHCQTFFAYFAPKSKLNLNQSSQRNELIN